MTQMEPISGLDALYSQLSPRMNIKFVDVTFLGRRLRGKNKSILLQALNKLVTYEMEIPAAHVDVELLADYRGNNQTNSEYIVHLVGHKICVGAIDKWKDLMNKFDKHSFRQEGSAASAGATTKMDFLRCYLASNVALVGFGSVVLDPFAGSGSIPAVSELFGAVSFASDVIYAASCLVTNTCIASALECPWVPGVFDAIVCDPPYGIRTALLEQYYNPGNNIEASERMRVPLGEAIFKDVIRMANSLLVDGGRLAMWWFEKKHHACIAHQFEQLCIEASELRHFFLVGVGYDDHGLGRSGDSQQDDISHQPTEDSGQHSWRRCLAVFQKGKSISIIRPIVSPKSTCNQPISIKVVAKPSLAVTGIQDALCQRFLKASWQGNILEYEAIAKQVENEMDISILCNITDGKGCTPLMLSCGFGRLKAVRWLLSHSANPSQLGTGNTTAMIRAAQFGHADCVVAMLEYVKRDDLLWCDESGMSAVAYALAFEHINVLTVMPMDIYLLNVLLSDVAGYPMHVIARWGCCKSFAFVLQACQSFYGTEPCCKHRFIEMVTIAMVDGTTPLHLAARYGHPAMCHLLVQHGAQCFARDAEHHTAAELARIWQRNPAKIFDPTTVE